MNSLVSTTVLVPVRGRGVLVLTGTALPKEEFGSYQVGSFRGGKYICFAVEIEQVFEIIDPAI